MADGIRISDAAIEMGSEELEAMVNRRGTAVRITRLDIAASQEAVNTLLGSARPAATEPGPGAPPSVQIEEGRLRVTLERDGTPFSLDLKAGALRLEFTAEGLRLATE